MPARTALSQLRALANELGIATTYETVDGVHHVAPAETILAAARAMRVPVDSVNDAADALRELVQSRTRRQLDPVIVARPGAAIALATKTAGSLHVETETGEHHVHRLEAGAQRISALPVGMHQLRFEPGDDSGVETATAIVAPPVAFRPDPVDARRWGLFAPAYALHDTDTGPIGGLRELARLADLTLDHGGRIVGTLPLLATFLGAGSEPYDPSPYSPVSRRFWNELYLDLRGLPEIDADAAAIADTSADGLVDPRAAAATRRPVLLAAAERLGARDSARRRSFREFVAADAQLPAYARFRAALEGSGDDGIRYHEYVQWAMSTQIDALATDLDRRGAGLYLDLPIGTNGAGFDVASNPDSFVTGMSVGSPPDSFFAEGQNWGFPPLDPRGLRATGYESLRATLEHHLRVARVLRIDHVMGLHRLFWIPEGESPTVGTYVAYPSEEIYALLSVLSHRYSSMVVGENLGTVPPSVNAALHDNGIDRMRVFELDVYEDPDDPLVQPEAETLTSLNTHDTPTFAAFWRGTDIDGRLEVGHTDATGAAEERDQRAGLRTSIVASLERRRLLDLDAVGETDLTAPPVEDAVLEAALGFTAASDADIALVALEDLWSETRAQNIPGTGPEVPNWRRRVARTLDAAAGDTRVRTLLDAVDQSRREPSPTPQGTESR